MRYWLMKSEPNVFSIQMLEKRKREPWDGVRNYQARNYMRDDMQKGDLVLFYHSNAEEKTGVAGICKIDSDALPDQTQFNPGSDYFDRTANPAAPRWWLREVAFVERFKDIITLETLRKQPALADMTLLRKGNRLSVMPISEKEFKAIVKLSKE